MIAIRLGLYLSLMLLVGLAAFPLYALRHDERPEGQVLPLWWALTFWSVTAITLSGLGLAALIAAMMGGPLTDIDWETSQSILFETPIGTAWLVRMAALAVVLMAAFPRRWTDEQQLGTIGQAELAVAQVLACRRKDAQFGDSLQRSTPQRQECQ